MLWFGDSVLVKKAKKRRIVVALWRVDWLQLIFAFGLVSVSGVQFAVSHGVTGSCSYHPIREGYPFSAIHRDAKA